MESLDSIDSLLTAGMVEGLSARHMCGYVDSTGPGWCYVFVNFADDGVREPNSIMVAGVACSVSVKV